MNNSYYKTLHENFSAALNLMENDLTHTQLIELLKNGNIPEKQGAVLRLESINSFEETDLLFQNLTGQDGKIREAVSNKLKELLLTSNLATFIDFNPTGFAKTMLLGLVDINGNVCRNILDCLETLIKHETFMDAFCEILTLEIRYLLELVEETDFQDGKYKVNKQVFKLYWCLEALDTVFEKVNFEDIKNILHRASVIQDYTIREKVAKILAKSDHVNELGQIIDRLKTDKNYYVRRFFEETTLN